MSCDDDYGEDYVMMTTVILMDDDGEDEDDMAQLSSRGAQGHQRSYQGHRLRLSVGLFLGLSLGC